MIGIKNIGVYIPDKRTDNLEKSEKFSVTRDFIENKIGILKTSKKDDDQKASDLCVLAYQELLKREKDLSPIDIDLVCVCSQNGDYALPHTSAVVHSKLDLPYCCASFDISLGCSGYPYALHIAKSFMETNDLSVGLLFTSDPYSEILDVNDKNTELIFGDGATVTLLSREPVYSIEKGVFSTDSKNYDQIIKKPNEWFFMNGRAVFEFVMKRVPESLSQCLKTNETEKRCIDLFLLHQASQYLIKNLVKRAKLDPSKVPISIKQFGNTVSSTIPVMLQDSIEDICKNEIILSGFGIGLSVASTLIKRVKR